jgi:hypothetical protein
LFLIFQSWGGILLEVLEGQRIARPFLKFLDGNGLGAKAQGTAATNFKKGWEESPNTTGRDAA